MKRVSIAEAKQTFPALVHQAERHGEIEITRRGKTVAYLVAADRHVTVGRPTFVEAFEAWRGEHAAIVGDEPLEIPRGRPARKATFPK